MLKTLFIVASVLMLAACDAAPPGPAFDDNAPAVNTFDNMLKVSSVVTMNATELASICTEAEHSLGHPPTYGLLVHLGKCISLIKSKGNQNSPKDLACQILTVAEKRGQLGNEAAIKSTIEILYKISEGTSGRVSPKEIIAGMRGMDAKKLSDDGLINIGAMISSVKRENGE